MATNLESVSIFQRLYSNKLVIQTIIAYFSISRVNKCHQKFILKIATSSRQHSWQRVLNPLPIQYVHIQYALLLNEIMENKPIKPWYLCTNSTLLYVLCNKTLNLLDVWHWWRAGLPLFFKNKNWVEFWLIRRIFNWFWGNQDIFSTKIEKNWWDFDDFPKNEKISSDF